MNLKRNKNLLNKRKDRLSKDEQKSLHALLLYSDDLRAAYELKEQLIDWYDCSFDYSSAKAGFER